MKTALVTGASRGIGREAAIRLASDGYKVFACARDKSRLASLEDLGITVYSCDVADEKSVDAMFDALAASTDSLDVLVNNAGVAHLGLLQDMTLDEWNHVLSTNLTGAFLCARRAIPMMLKRSHSQCAYAQHVSTPREGSEAEASGAFSHDRVGSSTPSGSIINISSMWGERGASMEVGYSASKGGLNAFTKALSKELAPSRIRVNAILCGVIDTSMNDLLDPEDKASLVDQIGEGRFGTPEDVASLVSFLASDKSSYLTGALIPLDGGFVG